jgi:aerobic-type carbon monoxide dehydrogenase small subunit (CoxS/CutS family)
MQSSTSDDNAAGDEERVSVEFRVNGELRRIEVPPRYLLSDVLREQLLLTGLHLGCEQGVCGACTVMIDGEPAVSCLTLAVEADGAEIQTAEQLCRTESGDLGRLERSFIEHGAFQCGFCTPGALTMGHYILDNGLATSRESVRACLSGNICRCTGYEPIVDAILAAAAQKDVR